jgi:hypothetical protein
MTKGQKVDLAIFAGLLVTACCLLIILVIVTTVPSNPVYRGDETSVLPTAKAVYLVQSPGQLATSELQAHPEVIVTNTVSDFKQHAQTRVALWIDKNTAMLGQAQYAVTRDDDIKRDLDLIKHLQTHGVAVLSVQQFLAKLDAGEMLPAAAPS